MQRAARGGGALRRSTRSRATLLLEARMFGPRLGRAVPLGSAASPGSVASRVPPTACRAHREPARDAPLRPQARSRAKGRASRRREVAARTNVSRETSARTLRSRHRCVRNRFEVTKITAVKLFMCIGALSCDENGPRVFRDLVFRCRGIPSRRLSASAGLHVGDFCDSAAVFHDERLACGPPRRPPVEHAPHHLVTRATCNRHAWRTGARYDRFNNN